MTERSHPAPSTEELVPDADGLVRRSWAIGGAALSSLEGGTRELHGDPDGDTVVLLHGIPASAELWRGVVPALVDAGHHVVALDLPGYGDTLLPSRGDHSLAGAAELLATWLRVHVARPAWVVGHDLGGAVAQVLASRHPALLARLTLSDAVFGDTWPVAQVRRLQLLARARLYPSVAGLVPRTLWERELRRGFADPARATSSLLQRVFLDGKVHDDAGRRAFARHLLALDPAQTVTAAGTLPRLPLPTQLVWGAEDVLLPFDEVGVRLRDALPDPAVTVLEDAGHFAPVERPDAFARALVDWEP